MSFNPYYYWSYLLTEFENYYTIDMYMIKSFNPYYYWSYLLTKQLNGTYLHRTFVSILIITGLIF